MSAEARVRELGLEITEPMSPAGSYVPAVITGDLVFLSGHGPLRADGSLVTGKVGADLTVAEGRDAARLVALQLLGALRHELGSLDQVARIVKVLCMVNATPAFSQHPRVADGASELFVEVFGEGGRHARSAVGMGSLPMNIPVEMELVAQIAS